MEPELRAYTYKDGLLARLAHDLQLTLVRFDVELTQGRVRARFELPSLRVDGVVGGDGALDGGALSGADQARILRHASEDVLDVQEYPEATFEGTLGGSVGSPTLDGRLTLRGRSETQPVTLELSDTECVARARLVPSRWGIRPFKALGGAIKLKDTIDVELRLPREGDVAGGDWQGASHAWQAGGA